MNESSDSGKQAVGDAQPTLAELTGNELLVAAAQAVQTAVSSALNLDLVRELVSRARTEEADLADNAVFVGLSNGVASLIDPGDRTETMTRQIVSDLMWSFLCAQRRAVRRRTAQDGQAEQRVDEAIQVGREDDLVIIRQGDQAVRVPLARADRLLQTLQAAGR